MAQIYPDRSGLRDQKVICGNLLKFLKFEFNLLQQFFWWNDVRKWCVKTADKRLGLEHLEIAVLIK